MRAGIGVDGLKETVRDFKRLGDEKVPKAIRDANLEAAETVAADARRRAPVRSGALRDTIRAAGQQTAAVVRAGSSRVRYAGYVDYGGTIAPKGTPIHRPYQRDGRIVYPAVRAQTNTVVSIYEQRLQEALDHG